MSFKMARQTFTVDILHIHLAKQQLGIKKTPYCGDCKHFIRDYTVHYGKCKMFLEINVATGHSKYKYASAFRENKPHRCGKEGRHFECRESEAE